MKNNILPTYDDIYNMYVLQNRSSDEVMQHYKISRSTFFRLIKRYEIKKDKNLINILRENTVKEKYGVSNISKLESTKNKKEETSLIHYGVKNINQSPVIRNKTRETCLNKYGFSAPAQNKDIIQKMQNTCMEKYHVKNPSLVAEFVEKRRETNQRRYGADCNLSLDSTKETIKQTCLKKYGIPYYCMSNNCRGISRGSKSKINEKIAGKLKNANLDFQTEFVLGKYIYDFKIDNILLEINPTYTHSIDFSYHNKSKKMLKDYHYLKSKNGADNGFVCIHVFD